MAFENVPESLRQVPNWVNWMMRDGKKIPLSKINDPAGFLTFEQALERRPFGGGIGFVLTNEDGLATGGLDLDGCRDPDSGELTDWAFSILQLCNSYSEVSPSKTGIKIFMGGCPKDISTHVLPIKGPQRGNKKSQIEIYSKNRYFCVTGEMLPAFGTKVKHNPDAWASIIKMVAEGAPPRASKGTDDGESEIPSGQRNSTMASIAGKLRRNGLDAEAILAALRSINQKRCKPPMDEGELRQIAESVGRYEASTNEFMKNPETGKVLSSKLFNVELALTRMQVDLKYNAFTDKVIVDQDNKGTSSLDDDLLAKIWFGINTNFGWTPTKEVLFDGIRVLAREHGFHPVAEYFSAITWDGKKRIDNWLTTYAGVEDNEYTRAVGALVLVAAVRRVREPGVKFDEMLVLVSPVQGTAKSSAIEALCPNREWYTDDLPIGCDSKEVIERTSGRWIVEASELAGMRKTEIEKLKGFLSRHTDSSRMAYGRTVYSKPRSFIVIGTTNNVQFLRDGTGNRRIWPVNVLAFDIDALKRDRDQIWSESVAREATGSSIRLPKELWPLAGEYQDAHMSHDPWEEDLEAALGNIQGRIPAKALWKIIGIEDNWRKDIQSYGRLSSLMQRLNFEHKRARTTDGRAGWCYARGENQKTIYLNMNGDGRLHATHETPSENPF